MWLRAWDKVPSTCPVLHSPVLWGPHFLALGPMLCLVSGKPQQKVRWMEGKREEGREEGEGGKDWCYDLNCVPLKFL